MSTLQNTFALNIATYHRRKLFLPSKINWKLGLIISLLQGTTLRKTSLSPEQKSEFQDLENLDQLGLKLIFNNIIQTLFSDASQISKSCLIKRNKGCFRSWVNGTIKFQNGTFLIRYGAKVKKYTFENCSVKKSSESKRCIYICHNTICQFTVKFETEQEMKNMLISLQTEIIDKKNQVSYLQMSSRQCSPVKESQNKRFSEVKIDVQQQDQEDQLPKQKTKLKKSSSLYQCFTIRQEQHEIQQQLRTRKQLQISTKNIIASFHGFKTILESQHLIIAMNQESSKIHIQIKLNQKAQIKKIISNLLIKKCWNHYIVCEQIQKNEDQSNSITIRRMYDTLKEIGTFLNFEQISVYTPFGSDGAMIISEGFSGEGENKLTLKSVITVEAKQSCSKIIIEEELKSQSSEYSQKKLKNILFSMNKDINKLQLLNGRIVNKNFQSQTIVDNLLEEDQTDQSQKEDLDDNDDITKSTIQDLQKEISPVDIIKNGSNLLSQFSTVRLKNTLQTPDFSYLKLIRQKKYEKGYFKCLFSQEIQQDYQDYMPHYKLDKMIQNKQYQILPSRELKFIDQDLLDNQKQTVKFVIKQIGGNLICGKSILNISLPVDIFESRTQLERGASSYAACPDFLQPVANSDAMTQLKSVTAFIVSAITCQLIMQKPFNPILGQTFQAYIKGIPIYYEQISHSPPISSYYMKCDEFLIYGNLVPFADLGLNTGMGGNSGVMHIVFPNNSHFQCFFPPSQIAGIIYGDRKFKCCGRGYILERNHKLFAQYSIQNPKKGLYQSDTKLTAGSLLGGIFQVKDQFIESLDKYREKNKNHKKFNGLTKDSIVKKHHQIIGQWFSEIYIDGDHINKNVKLYPLEYAKSVLPSDSNHRLDVLYHKMHLLPESQKEKQVFEVIQRNDKKLRQKGQKK